MLSSRFSAVTMMVSTSLVSSPSSSGAAAEMAPDMVNTAVVMAVPKRLSNGGGFLISMVSPFVVGCSSAEMLSTSSLLNMGVSPVPASRMSTPSCSV